MLGPCNGNVRNEDAESVHCWLVRGFIFSHKHQQDKPLLLRFPSHISRNLLGHVISGKVSKIQNDVGKMFEKWWVLKPSISCNVLQELLTECHVVSCCWVSCYAPSWQSRCPPAALLLRGVYSSKQIKCCQFL